MLTRSTAFPHFARGYEFRGTVIVVYRNRRLCPKMVWPGQAGATCSTCINRDEAARYLQWWRAQSQEAAR